MKDLSFFFLKNSMGAKMRRGFRNVCKNDDSTSTLNQQVHNPCYKHEPTISSSSSQLAPPSSSNSYMENDHFTLDENIGPPRKSVTLEEMILQLELEEEIARKEKAKNKLECRRMSCVNNSDILRSARNAALNQYPRFSLDGRDSMYRSSFRNNNNHSFDGLKLGRLLHLPQCLGGESVVWCKPGVVPKLMGLEAMPVPVRRFHNNNNNINNRDQRLYNNMSTRVNQNLRRRAQMNEFERRQHGGVDTNVDKRSGRGGGRGGGGGGSGSNCCTSTSGYCVMNPIALEPVLGLGGPISWPNQYHYT